MNDQNEEPGQLNNQHRKHVVIIWTKFLPYHLARIRHLQKRIEAEGYRLTAIEVASQDALYPFPQSELSATFDYVCVFPGASYRTLNPIVIDWRIHRMITRLKPDYIFSPSTPFPSGMASIQYSLVYGSQVIIMDDAWEYSDRRGRLVTAIKKLIHRNVDAAFLPAPSHASYFEKMGIPRDRQVYGVDVVDNDYFSSWAQEARSAESVIRSRLGLPQKYFLFVGRLIKRKGVDRLITAYRSYKKTVSSEEAWGLVIIGEGDEKAELQQMARGERSIVFAGSRFGNELCTHYGLAACLVLPSEVETWGLVVNEAMAAGLPVLVSSGCGCAKTLVQEEANGWHFPPYDTARLAEAMQKMSSLSQSRIEEMSKQSKKIISQWSLDTFADSVMTAIALPRRKRGGLLSKLVTHLWRGRISFYP
ncbi:MAG: glycosyltransferase family 4 protein [Ignavibacteriales bacterium]|nr:glycosyltransferase family 4 protein [Ignavibacteriales bacterium]